MKKVLISAWLATAAVASFAGSGTFWDSGFYHIILNNGAGTRLGLSSGEILSQGRPQRWWAEAFRVPSGGVDLTKITANGFVPGGSEFTNLYYTIWKRKTGNPAPVDGDQVFAPSGAVTDSLGKSATGFMPFGAAMNDPRTHYRDSSDAPFNYADYYEIPLGTPLHLPAGNYWLTVYGDLSVNLPGFSDSNFAWMTGAPGQLEADHLVTGGGVSYGYRSESFPTPGFAAYTLPSNFTVQPGDLPEILESTTFSLEGNNLASGTRVSGKLVLSDWKGPVGQYQFPVEVRLPGTTTVVQNGWISPDGAIGDGQGAYSLVLPTAIGTKFDLSIQVIPFLRRTVTVDVSNGDVTQDLVLINGDIDGDNQVTVFDYNLLSAAFDSTTGDANWNPDADLDGDGSVTVFDYNILSQNFDLSGD